MKCYFIFNPNSGKGKILKKVEYIKSRLQERFGYVEVVKTLSRKHLMESVKNACEDASLIVFSGGDGTVNDVLNSLTKSVPLGLIPSGTCNDFASSHNIPKNIKKALDIICSGSAQNFDIFEANGRRGVYVCTSGIFTSASYDTKQKSKRIFGKLGYYFHAIKEVFRTKSMDISFSLDGKEPIRHNSVLFLMINSSSVAGWKINKKTNLADGKMDFVSVETKKKNGKMGLMCLLTICKMFLFGIKSVKKSKRVKVENFENANVCSQKPLKINIDGEYLGNGNVDIKVIKNGISLICK